MWRFLLIPIKRPYHYSRMIHSWSLIPIQLMIDRFSSFIFHLFHRWHVFFLCILSGILCLSINRSSWPWPILIDEEKLVITPWRKDWRVFYWIKTTLLTNYSIYMKYIVTSDLWSWFVGEVNGTYWHWKRYKHEKNVFQHL